MKECVNSESASMAASKRTSFICMTAALSGLSCKLVAAFVRSFDTGLQNVSIEAKDIVT